MAGLLGREEYAANKILRDHIYKRYENQDFPQEWRNLPELPSKSEICPPSQKSTGVADSKQEGNLKMSQMTPVCDQNLPHNIVDGPWPSREAYLGAHYQILREDSIAPLRRAVSEFKKCPALVDDVDTCVYKDVTIKGLVFAKTGVAWRVEFSPQKQIKWKQSKRLLQGSLIALSSDLFKNECKMAIVVGRGLSLLNQNPPAIELFWADSEEAVIDPVKKYVMLEARQGYFEASRHVLVALQKLMTERFQLENHIWGLDRDIKAPSYIEDQPLMNLSSLEKKDDIPSAMENDPDRYINVDALRNFPNSMNSGMDKSQVSACEMMLTNRIAIVQGPPGTGKTFTSISALRVMIDNLGPNDPPILVAAQTNHALDQLLNHILRFEPNILRLGGRSNKANKAILERTLYNLRQSNRIPRLFAGWRQAQVQQTNCINSIKDTMESLRTDGLLTADILRENRLISAAQHKSLTSKWEGSNESGDIADWLTTSQLMPVPETAPIHLGLAVEQADIELEELVEDIDNEFKTDATDETEQDPEDDEGLRGEWMPFKRKFTGRHSHPPALTEKQIKQKLNGCKNLHDIPVASRGEIYRFWESEMSKTVANELKVRLKEYQETVKGWAIARHLSNIRLIRHLGIKVIGCTTTGLSKYRSLLSAVKSRALLIEEAAETLEANVIGGLLDSIEHLILVGDHAQLQASATIRALENAPYHLNISMFERLINNSIRYVMLNVQRRMIREVRKLLCIDPSPFYTDLQDHKSVLDRIHNRPSVPGMGGLDTYFFDHRGRFEEATNAENSRYNLAEAQMIAKFFLYLCQNGVDPSKITVLTFYNGQKSVLIQELRGTPGLGKVRQFFNVFTVDSYQGEENDIILLSLVRSNSNLSIGFLNSKNRLVVALSRARRGLYLFGDARTLAANETNEDLGYRGREPLWYPLIQHMIREKQFGLDGSLPVTCSKHGKTTKLFNPRQFDELVNSGGCDQNCDGFLPCGHACKHTCHSRDHKELECPEACQRKLTCGHGCSSKCTQKCYCAVCELYDDPVAVPNYATEKDFFEGTGPSAWEDSPPKSSMKRSTSQKPNEKHVSFVPEDKLLGPALGERSVSGPLMGKQISPPKFGEPRLSTPNKPRSVSMQSRGSGPSSSGTVVRRPAFAAFNCSPETWQNWDAKKADEELAEKRRVEAAAAPKVDLSTYFFQETFIPTSLNENGERVYDPSGARFRAVKRNDATLADSLFTPQNPRVADSPSKEQDQPKFRGPYRIDRPEISEDAMKRVYAASKALIEVTNNMSGLSMSSTMMPAFGRDDEDTMCDQKMMERLSNAMQKTPDGRGPGDKSGASNYSRGLSTPTPRGGSFRGKPNRGRSGFRGESYRGTGPFRGNNAPRGGASFRGNDLYRGRGFASGGPALVRGRFRGGQRQLSQVQSEATDNFLESGDNLPISSSQPTSTFLGDLADFYGSSHPRPGVNSYQSAWGVEPSTSPQNTQSRSATQSSFNQAASEDNLIDFD